MLKHVETTSQALLVEQLHHSHKEMSDGRHGTFDGHILRWSDGKIWRRVEEQSGMHQAGRPGTQSDSDCKYQQAKACYEPTQSPILGQRSKFEAFRRFWLGVVLLNHPIFRHLWCLIS
jgi:hypothetical protein